jgi:hypothetical protein
MNGISCEDERPEQDAQGGLLGEAWKAEVGNSASVTSNACATRIKVGVKSPIRE